jgi:hypothetical protein
MAWRIRTLESAKSTAQRRHCDSTLRQRNGIRRQQ